MKSIGLLLFSMLILLSSCFKDLDQNPLSTVTTDTYFATARDFQMAVSGVYGVALRGATKGNSYGYPDRLMNLGETRSDNLYAITDGARDWEGINDFQSTIGNNTYVSEAWVNDYAAIAKANLLLEKLEEKGKAIVNSDSLVTRYTAETRFLRAFCYFDLVRWYGPVPIVDKSLVAEQGVDYPREPVEKVYDFIISDLEYAAANLPASYPAKELGRVTKWAAKGILAEVYMAMSGPTYNIKGPGLAKNEWAKAYSLLNEIAEKGGFAMEADYSTIFRTEHNKEIIFDVEYSSGDNATGGSFVWILTPDGYFKSIGFSAQGSNYQRPLATSFRSVFAPGDVRANFGIGDSFVDNTSSNPVTYDYPFYIKWVDPARYGTGRTDWGVNFPVLRYTDVLMLRAECTLHGGGGTQSEVDDIVHKVRVRAGDNSPVSGITLDQLFAERRKEFFEEGTRWFDLQRSGKLVEHMEAFRLAEDAMNHRVEPITNNAVIYPVPQSEMVKHPGLYTQNPGYDE